MNCGEHAYRPKRRRGVQLQRFATPRQAQTSHLPRGHPAALCRVTSETVAQPWRWRCGLLLPSTSTRRLHGTGQDLETGPQGTLRPPARASRLPRSRGRTGSRPRNGGLANGPARARRRPPSGSAPPPRNWPAASPKPPPRPRSCAAPGTDRRRRRRSRRRRRAVAHRRRQPDRHLRPAPASRPTCRAGRPARCRPC